MEKFDNYPNIFYEHEPIYISEKVSGIYFFAGWVQYAPKTFKEQFLDLFGFYDGWRFQYEGPEEFGELLKGKIEKKYRVTGVVADGKPYVHDIYDITIDKYLDYYRNDYAIPGVNSQIEKLFPIVCYEMQLERVPELYSGPFKKVIVDSFRKGTSHVNEANKRLGIVIRPQIEKTASFGRKIVKCINPEF
jgi:hypothetical protein